MNNITIGEFRDIFKYLIKNNFKLMEKGTAPIAVCAEGGCGIGKTKVIESIAEELGMTYKKLTLSELEEVGDLCGLPVKEYEVTFDDCPGCPKWVAVDILNNIHKSFDFTGRSRMSYATPAWLPREENPNGILLNIDDFTRANTLFQQALMELINTGKYGTWDLPPKTVIALTANPDNGEYLVNSQDPAMRTRYANFPVRFEISEWAEWAESAELEGRGINFALSYADELFKEERSDVTINARSYTMFINAISGIEDWSKPESLALILNIAKGCFNDPDNIVGNLFTTFIANKLDKLISPEDMLFGKWETIAPKIEKCVYDGDDYKPSVASILQTRLLNKSIDYFSKPGGKTDVVLNRILEIIDAKKMLFGEDFLFNIIKTLSTKFPARFNKAMLNGRIRQIVLN